MDGDVTKTSVLKSRLSKLMLTLSKFKRYKLAYRITHDHINQKISVVGIPVVETKSLHSLHYARSIINSDLRVPHVFLCDVSKLLIEAFADEFGSEVEYEGFYGEPVTEDELRHLIDSATNRYFEIESKIRNLEYRLIGLK